ncbi:MAG: chemotaxis protein CheW [Myxococcota bacterium]|jgi:purine-binding chemotaxis protein CheW
MQKQQNTFVVFSIDGQRIAIHFALVDRVVLAAEITRLPESPPLVLGVVKVGHEVIPAINLRKIFGLPEREIEPSDQFILAHANDLKVALVVDSVEGIVEVGQSEMVTAESIFPGITGIEGVIDGGATIILVEDLEALLLKEGKVILLREMTETPETMNAPESP